MYPIVVVAAAMAALFTVKALTPPRPARILAAVLWGAHAVYEYYIANGTLCDANCNIRVDLALFIPVLGSATYLALQRAPRSGAVAALYICCLGLTALLAMLLGYNAVAMMAALGTLIAVIYAVKLLTQSSAPSTH